MVLKLLQLTQPRRAYFGQKDVQQLVLVRQLVRDFALPVRIVACPTVRDPDGLALSSRNAYLDPGQRRAATCLVEALRAAERAHRQGERDPSALRQAMLAVVDSEPLAKLDYAELVDPATFESPGALAVLAVRIGPVRLIDNHRLGDELD